MLPMPRSTLTDPVRELIRAATSATSRRSTRTARSTRRSSGSDVDGDHVVLNSAQGRRWPENVKRTGRATLLIANAEDQYEYVFIQAVLESATRGGRPGRHRRPQREVRGPPYPPLKPGEVRVTLRFAPERVMHRGGN